VAALFGRATDLPAVAHYTKKVRFAPAASRRPLPVTPAPLARVYVLASTAGNNEPRITPLTSREAFVELLQGVFRLDITDRARLDAEFERLSGLARLPIFRRLALPRDLASLPRAVAAIVADLR